MSTQTVHPATAGTTKADPRLRELDLFAFLLMLIRHIPFIVGCSIVAFVGMVLYMLHIPARYQATSVMIVPQGNVSTGALAAQIPLSTFDLLGGGYELYADILNSHQVEDRLIQDFDLQKVYGAAELADAESALQSQTGVVTQRDGVVRVTVLDSNPKRAADLANDYFRQLDNLNKSLVRGSISQQVDYLRGEMYREKGELENAEVTLKNLEVNNNGVAPVSQEGAGVSALDTARANLRAAQIRRDSLLTGETEQNPDVVRVNSEIAGLEGQIETLQRGGGGDVTGPSTSQVPEKTLQFTRQQREVAFHQTLFDALAKQYQAAQEQANKDPSVVQMLDPARPAIHKAWPPRTYYCVMAAVVGAVVGTVLVALRALLLGFFNTPENQERWRQLKNVYRREVQHKA